MEIARCLQRVMRIPGRIAYEAELHIWLTWMRLVHRYGRSSITSPGGPVVSLTTYGQRTQTVHLAIESIGRGQTRPSRLILWLDEPLPAAGLPIGLRRLQKHGLEVRHCENYGPHKKYYPYLESLQEVEIPLVTADDDLLYPRNWLRDLVKAYRQFPEVINCHRARVMALDQTGIADYESWEPANSTRPSFCHFAVGLGGVIYPPSFLRALKIQATGFVSCCPKADDIWLHVQALRAGYKVRQIKKKCFHLLYIPGTQETALRDQNYTGGGNDLQIKATYQASDIDRLRECD